MGMNSVDIYECVSYNKGVLAYDRAKTRDRRNDNAHIEIVVPDIINLCSKNTKEHLGSLISIRSIAMHPILTSI